MNERRSDGSILAVNNNIDDEEAMNNLPFDVNDTDIVEPINVIRKKKSLKKKKAKKIKKKTNDEDGTTTPTTTTTTTTTVTTNTNESIEVRAEAAISADCLPPQLSTTNTENNNETNETTITAEGGEVAKSKKGNANEEEGEEEENEETPMVDDSDSDLEKPINLEEISKITPGEQYEYIPPTQAEERNSRVSISPIKSEERIFMYIICLELLKERIMQLTQQHEEAVREREKYEDIADNRTYYVNKFTGESQWDAPIGFSWTQSDIQQMARTTDPGGIGLLTPEKNDISPLQKIQSNTSSGSGRRRNNSYEKFLEERQKEREDLAFIEERKRLKESIKKLEKQSVMSGGVYFYLLFYFLNRKVYQVIILQLYLFHQAQQDLQEQEVYMIKKEID